MPVISGSSYCTRFAGSQFLSGLAKMAERYFYQSTGLTAALVQAGCRKRGRPCWACSIQRAHSAAFLHG